MRIVFMGTPETAVPALDTLLAEGHALPLIVTQPDRPSGRSRAPQASPVKVFASARGLTVVQPLKIRTAEFADTIAAARPDAIVVVAYGRILPKAVLDAAPHGAINLHFSLLPAYRGAAPVQWALASGERDTGVTTFRLDEGLDTGPILAQRRVAITPGEHAPALLSRLSREGAALLAETMAGLDGGRIVPSPQNDAAATAAPVLTKEDGGFSAAWTAAMLEGRVRGFDPWPGVWARCGTHRLRIVEAHAVHDATTDAAPGTVLGTEGSAVRLACAAGSVAGVASVQREGGRAMTAREAVSGRWLCAGDRLGPPIPTS